MQLGPDLEKSVGLWDIMHTEDPGALAGRKRNNREASLQPGIHWGVPKQLTHHRLPRGPNQDRRAEGCEGRQIMQQRHDTTLVGSATLWVGGVV